MTRKLLAIASALAMSGSALAANVFFDYADILISFSTGGTLTVADHAGTSLKANLRNNADVAVDQANIGSAADFDVLLTASVSNPAGLDNIGMSGSLSGTDDSLTNRYESDFMNTAFGADLDGVTFAGGILTIRGVLDPLGLASSILTGPAGDWIFAGTDDAPIGLGLDGVADQFTVAAASRDSYTTGTVFVIDISIPVFGDGSSTAGFTNADDFFAAALSRDGFTSTGGDMKINITPTPGAALLGLAGLAAVAGLRRRVA